MQLYDGYRSPHGNVLGADLRFYGCADQSESRRNLQRGDERGHHDPSQHLPYGTWHNSHSWSCYLRRGEQHRNHYAYASRHHSTRQAFPSPSG